jgi:hypothetical protein
LAGITIKRGEVDTLIPYPSPAGGRREFILESKLEPGIK